MNLNEFLKDAGMKQNVFCERAGVSPPTIYKILLGGDYCLSTARKIIKGSKGKISIEALLKAVRQLEEPTLRHQAEK